MFELEVKIIADVGLVGYPNAGKSTLLHSISRARPTIANYAFTTLHPNIGTVQFRDHHSLSVADIPGLVDGASENVGLGHGFLKHIERTKVLLFVLDASGTHFKSTTCKKTLRMDLPLPEIPAVVAYLNLKRELELYDPKLLEKPRLVVLNKTDLLLAMEDGASKLQALTEELHRHEPHLAVFSMAANNEASAPAMQDMVQYLRQVVGQVEEQQGVTNLPK